MKCIYILKHKPTGEIIGATSPSTLFFSSANTFNVNRIDIPLSSTHKAFDGIVQLNERSWGFQKYLYTWLEVNNEVRNMTGKHVFAEVKHYLDAQKQISIDNGDREATDFEVLNSEKDESGNLLNYTQLRSPDVEILGKYWYELDSNNDTAAVRGILTADDLLESKIIRIPSNIQRNSYFDGNIPPECGYTYLLPIKDEFFRHYTIEELKRSIKIGHYSQYADVTLEIGGKTYRKEFKSSEGNIIEKSQLLEFADFMLFPNVKFPKDKDAYYRFGLFIPYNEREHLDNYSVSFYHGDDRVECENPVIRNTCDNRNSICKTYSLNQKLFDRIKITIEGASGVLLPTLPAKGVADNFTFAVDFGTTNTHIEYNTSLDHNIKPFEINETDKQISFLCGNNNLHTLVSDVDFIPALIGGDTDEFKFPIRTALSIHKNRGIAERVFPFVQANVIIPYEKRIVPKYNRVLTQLKWDSTEDEMGYYIDSLCFMLRNKVVLNGGNLSETKIVWFYPLSMAGSRSKIIRDKWLLAYSKYFLGAYPVTSINDLEESQKEILGKNVINLPESVAPFLYYKNDIEYRDTINNLVAIDIGGGTTDIVFVEDGKTKYVTSFRFAANSVFGLGENITPVVSKYKSDIKDIILDKDRAGGAKYDYLFDNIYKDVVKDTEKGDIASFFFSLKNHKRLQNVNVDFNSMLKGDSDQKLIFVLFYSAIIYHIARIMKAKEMKLPRHIAFSGNGSRIVNIVGDKDVLVELSKSIFEKVYEDEYGNSGLDIIQNTRNPKEVTCKGGIRAADRDYVQEPFEPLVLLETDDKNFVANKDTYSSVDIEDSVIKTSCKVKEFIEYVIDELMNEEYTKGVVSERFVDALNVNQQALEIAKDVLKKEDDLANFTRNSIKNKIDSIDNADTTKIEETFFFYPITSLLNAISNEINKKD